MTQTKSTYHHGDLKRALITQALDTIEAHGVPRLSLRACARALDVDVAATYRHFKNKNDLLAAVAATGFGMLAEAMRTHSAQRQTSRARFEAIGEAYVMFALTHEHLYGLMFHGPCHAEQIDAQRHDLLDAQIPGPYDQLISTLDALHDEGLIDPGVRPQAELLAWSTIHGLSSLLIAQRIDPSDARAQARACCAMILDGLGPHTAHS